LNSNDAVENTPQPEAPQEAQPDMKDNKENNGKTKAQFMNPDCTREVEVKISADVVSKEYDTVIGKYQKHAKIPGFRDGKVPESVIRNHFADDIRREVIDNLLPERFNKAVLDLGVTPAGKMQVTELTVEDGQPLHVKAMFEIIQDFSIEGYQDVTVEKPLLDVTDDEFHREMEQLQESRATIEPIAESRAIVDGDWVQVALQGADKNQIGAAPVIHQEAMIEVGSKQTLPAFSEVLRGSTVGQTLKAEVVYPADYGSKELAGKTVAYEIEVKAIKKHVVPELNDALAKEVGNYDTLAELENDVRKNLAARKRQSVEGETKKKILASLAERYPFPVPETMVRDQIDVRMERGLRSLAAQGMSAEQMRELDFANLWEAQRDDAVAEVKATILLDRIASEEKLTISNEELDQELRMAALQSKEPLESLRAKLASDGRLDRVRQQMLREKTATVLYERLTA
jgi:trigger factor